MPIWRNSSWTMTVPISDAWKARLAQVSDAATRRLAVDQARQEVKRAVKGLGYNVADGNLGGILRELAEKWQITGGEYSLYDQRILEVEDLSATWDPIAFVGSDASPEIVYLSKSSTGYRVNRRPINGEPSTAKITTPILQASPIGVIADGPGDACAYFVQGFVQHSSATAPRRVPDTVSVLRFAMNGKLIGGLGDGGVFVLDEPFLSPAIVRHHKAGIVDIRVVSPEEGLQFVSLSADGQVCLWMYTPADALTLRRDFGYVRDTAVCVGIVGVRTKRIVVLGKTGRLHVLGRSPSTLELHPKVAIDGATISQDGRMLAAIDADLQLRLWQLYET
ncbi:MAG: WD40 repeat domain-containing protein [Myxococcales bacterium]|nr:WD40 repeat domain-containing protein [Myxococcales bacterium]